ncbi:MAG: hypothetical protein IKA44_05965 [Clostridia bacterium]|nr:hypothetical protein [Clostridia bacterium]
MGNDAFPVHRLVKKIRLFFRSQIIRFLRAIHESPLRNRVFFCLSVRRLVVKNDLFYGFLRFSLFFKKKVDKESFLWYNGFQVKGSS